MHGFITTYDKLIIVLTDFSIKIRFVFNTFFGWIMLSFNSVLFIFGEKVYLMNWVLLALLLDLIFGVWSSMIRKKFHVSTALVSTAIKLVMYMTLFFMPLILEKIIHNDISFATVGVTALLVSAEFFSIMTHMLIIKPNMPIIGLFSKVLSGEISKKLQIPQKDIDEYFRLKKEESITNKQEVNDLIETQKGNGND